MSIEEKRDQLMEELMPFEDHLERFTYIIDRAKSIDPLPRTARLKLSSLKDVFPSFGYSLSLKMGLCQFQADSDASITKGTAGLLCELYSDETPEDIVRMEPDFLADVGITQHLSPNRRNGLTGVREKIKAYAQMQIDHAG